MTQHYKLVGIMSGTSLDGLDLVICSFYLKDRKWIYQIEKAKTIEYSQYWKNKLCEAHKISGFELLMLDREFGKFIGETVNNFIHKENVKIDTISSHGHTVFHQPEKGLTFQLGNGANIHAITGIPTISDFRIIDVAHGGQGAPLVPLGDELLFNQYDCCLNLGGFANISFNDKNKRIAYDVCPVNIVLNRIAKQFDKDYDKNGNIGRTGKINSKLLDELNGLEYYQNKYPKSLAREWVDKVFLPILENYKEDTVNIFRTVYEHIKFQIGKSLCIKENKEVFTTGGGALNKFLIKLLKEIKNVSIIVPTENIVQFKEALIFAFLGLLKLRNEINCLKSVTGAQKDTICGVIHSTIN